MDRRDALGKMGMLAAGAAAGVGLPDIPGMPAPGSGPCFDVRAFGATGDGKADDSGVAQKAIDAATDAGEARVHFPSGQYRLGRGLVVSREARLDITGDGFSSDLRFEADEPALTWTGDAPCRMSSVRDLCLSSVGTDKSPETPAIACLGGTEWGTLFDHLYFRGDGARLGGGIAIDKVADTTTFNHCTIWGVTGTGLTIARGSEARIIGGRIIGAADPYNGLPEGSVGILLTGDSGGVHVLTTDIIALDTGMQVGLPGGNMNREIFITHATFDSCRNGLWIRNAAYVSIAGCWAASSDEAQIISDSEQGVLTPGGAILVINGGTVGNGGAYGRPGGHHGLVVRSGSLVMNGAALWHNKGHGIKVEGDRVRDVAVSGCRFSNNGVAADWGGVRGIASGNMLVDNKAGFTGAANMQGTEGNCVLNPDPA
jgi:hypothetical protein